MQPFAYRDGRLYCEDLPVEELAARHGTPLYLYSALAFTSQYESLCRAFAAVDPLVCYSVKANSNLGILKLMAQRGSGFDVVSVGELRRVLAAGGDPARTVFAGVGKTDDEIRTALEAGVLMFNVESEEELAAIDRVARSLGQVASVALRVNPDVDPKTHRYISTGKKQSKFGMDIERSERLAGELAHLPGVRLTGIHMHIGSQITAAQPFADAIEKGVALVGRLRAGGHPVSWYNMGGGFGISYEQADALGFDDFAAAMLPGLKASGCRIALEPGRSICANGGILVSRVIYTKQSGDKRFLIQDAAMNDLIRPALYESYHRIWPVTVAAGYSEPASQAAQSQAGLVPCDVVGPICESGDFLAKDRLLPPVQSGDLLAVFSAGAYGMVMASNYNSRPRAAEILVSGDRARVVRRRETLDELISAELLALDPD